MSAWKILVTLLVTLLVSCCTRDPTHERHGRGEHSREGHDRDGGEHGEHGEGGEESGTELALDATYDQTRNGAHLTLAYVAADNAFVGKVQNTTKETLEAVRVEVHLSNGRELGPTKAEDLAPGAVREVRLVAESKGFTGWSAHPEVGRNEHGHGGEHEGGERGEHGRERRGEHR